MSIPVVFVCSENDFIKLKIHISKFKERISNNIVIIGKASLKNLCSDDIDITFLDEDKLLPGLTFSKIKELIIKRNPNPWRTGWYFQQFLKMAYSFICTEPYYLIWDADTIPLNKYNSTELFFDVKTEYRKSYFDTINKLFPELSKKAPYSYISEHMIIDSKIMRELINKIQEIISDKPFYEIIMEKIETDELSGAGFSEFETYGTYVQFYHPRLYKIRKWYSLRDGNDWCTYEMLDDKMEKWLRKSFDAVSFDNWQNFDKAKSDFIIKMNYRLKYETTLFIYRCIRKISKIIYK